MKLPLNHGANNSPSVSRMGVRRFRIQFAQPFDETRFIHRANLIQRNFTGLALERNFNSCRPTAPNCRHRSDNHGGNSAIQFVGRNHHTRAGLGGFCAGGWIKSNEEDVEPFDHHRHSFASNSLAICRVAARSSEAGRGRRKDLLQFTRALRRGRSSKPLADGCNSKP